MSHFIFHWQCVIILSILLFLSAGMFSTSLRLLRRSDHLTIFDYSTINSNGKSFDFDAHFVQYVTEHSVPIPPVHNETRHPHFRRVNCKLATLKLAAYQPAS